MILPAPSNGSHLPADVDEVFQAITPILTVCLKRVRSWPVPRNWSSSDWFDEVKNVAAIAAWQAGFNRHTPKNGMFASFVSQRIMSSARTRYRQEYLFGLRFSGRLAGQDSNADEQNQLGETEPKSIEPAAEPVPAYDDLREALSKLSADHRTVLEQLFWFGKTETELAESIGISQRGVSKRKQAALKILKEHLFEK